MKLLGLFKYPSPQISREFSFNQVDEFFCLFGQRARVIFVSTSRTTDKSNREVDYDDDDDDDNGYDDD